MRNNPHTLNSTWYQRCINRLSHGIVQLIGDWFAHWMESNGTMARVLKQIQGWIIDLLQEEVPHLFQGRTFDPGVQTGAAPESRHWICTQRAAEAGSGPKGRTCIWSRWSGFWTCPGTIILARKMQNGMDFFHQMLGFAWWIHHCKCTYLCDVCKYIRPAVLPGWHLSDCTLCVYIFLYVVLSRKWIPRHLRHVVVLSGAAPPLPTAWAAQGYQRWMFLEQGQSTSWQCSVGRAEWHPDTSHPPHPRLPTPKTKTPNPSPQQGPQTPPCEDLLTCCAQQMASHDLCHHTHSFIEHSFLLFIQHQSYRIYISDSVSSSVFVGSCVQHSALSIYLYFLVPCFDESIADSRKSV